MMTVRLIRAFTDGNLLDAEAQQLRPSLSAYTKQTSAAGQFPVFDTEDSTATRTGVMPRAAPRRRPRLSGS